MRRRRRRSARRKEHEEEEEEEEIVNPGSVHDGASHPLVPDPFFISHYKRSYSLLCIVVCVCRGAIRNRIRIRD